jgi:hypothetical protein
MIKPIPNLRYLVRFIKNSPKKGTNKNPRARGVGTRKSIIVCLSESIVLQQIVGSQSLQYRLYISYYKKIKPPLLGPKSRLIYQ